MKQNSDKRERLIEAAKRLFYSRGFAGTSLADVAEEAEIAVGNVYYYFKTKEQLAESVVDSYHEAIQGWNLAASAGATPQECLKLWLRGYYEMSVEGEDWNCPFGRLLVDMRQHSERLGEMTATLYHSMMNWAEAEFLKLDPDAQVARGRAQTLVARAQGLGLLAVVLQNRQELLVHFRDIEAWIEQL